MGGGGGGGGERAAGSLGPSPGSATGEVLSKRKQVLKS